MQLYRPLKSGRHTVCCVSNSFRLCEIDIDCFEGKNLPMEVDNSVLAVLFQQYVYRTILLHVFSLSTNIFSRYQGFLSAQTSPSPTPNAAGQPAKVAQVLFESADYASAAKEAVDGFTLKKGWKMSVGYF